MTLESPLAWPKESYRISVHRSLGGDRSDIVLGYPTGRHPSERAVMMVGELREMTDSA